MIVIDGKNTRGDLFRLLQRLVVYAMLLILGALAMYYRQGQAQTNNVKCYCEPIIKLYELPSQLSKTGAF